VTIILGDNSFIHKNKKNPEINRGLLRSAARVRQDGDSAGELGLGLVICLFMLSVVGFCFFFYMNDTLFKSFSMHLYIPSYMI
jgi:hypothetical protein